MKHITNKESNTCCPHCGADAAYIQQSSVIVLTEHRTDYPNRVGHVIYIEADNKHVIYHVLESEAKETVKTIRVCCSLDEVEKHPKLQHGFVRIHRSFIINVFLIRAISNDELWMKYFAHKTFSVGKTFRSRLDDALMKWKPF